MYHVDCHFLIINQSLLVDKQYLGHIGQIYLIFPAILLHRVHQLIVKENCDPLKQLLLWEKRGFTKMAEGVNI